jgi:hypothetical protein
MRSTIMAVLCTVILQPAIKGPVSQETTSQQAPASELSHPMRLLLAGHSDSALHLSAAAGTLTVTIWKHAGHHCG